MRAGDPAARAKHEEWPPSEEAMAEQVRDALFGWVCQLSAGGVAGEDAAGGAGGGAVAPRDTKDTEVFAVIRRAIRGRLEESPEDADCGEAWAFGTAGAQMRVVPSCEDRPQPRACMEGELKLALVDIWLRFPPGSAEAARRIAQAVDGWQLRNSFRPTVPRDSYLPCAVDVVTLMRAERCATVAPYGGIVDRAPPGASGAPYRKPVDIAAMPQHSATESGGTETAMERSDLIMTGTRVFSLSNLMSSEECAYYIREVQETAPPQPVDWEYSPRYRSCRRSTVRCPELASALWERIQAVLRVDDVALVRPFGFGTDGSWAPVGVNDVFRITRNDVGDHFNAHRDGAFVIDNENRSIYTLMVYLGVTSDGATPERLSGGQTRFWQDRGAASGGDESAGDSHVDVVPEVGNGVVFCHDVWHEGMHVAAGCKWVLRTDIMFHRVSRVRLDHATLVHSPTGLSSPDAKRAEELYQESIRLQKAGDPAGSTAAFVAAQELQATVRSVPVVRAASSAPVHTIGSRQWAFVLSYLAPAEVVSGLLLTSRHLHAHARNGRYWRALFVQRFGRGAAADAAGAGSRDPGGNPTAVINDWAARYRNAHILETRWQPVVVDIGEVHTRYATAGVMPFRYADVGNPQRAAHYYRLFRFHGDLNVHVDGDVPDELLPAPSRRTTSIALEHASSASTRTKPGRSDADSRDRDGAAADSRAWLSDPVAAAREDEDRAIGCFPSLVHLISGHYWCGDSGLRHCEVGYKVLVGDGSFIGLNVPRLRGRLQGYYARNVIHEIFENSYYPLMSDIACGGFSYSTWDHGAELAEPGPEVAHPLLLAVPPLDSMEQRRQLALLFCSEAGAAYGWTELYTRSYPVMCPYVAFVSSAILSMKAAGLSTGVVLAVGFSTAWVAPVIDGVQCDDAVQRIDIPVPNVEELEDDIRGEAAVSDALTASEPIYRIALTARLGAHFDWTNPRETWLRELQRATRDEPIPWGDIAEVVVAAADKAAAAASGKLDPEVRAALLEHVLLSGGSTMGDATEAEIRAALHAADAGCRVVAPADRVNDVVRGGLALARSPESRRLFVPSSAIVQQYHEEQAAASTS